jgi:hypothetical protein
MNRTVNPNVSEVAEVLAGVPAGCFGKDEDVRQCYPASSGAGHSAQVAVRMEGRRGWRAVGGIEFPRFSRQ